jgi:hypothetical protein
MLLILNSSKICASTVLPGYQSCLLSHRGLGVGVSGIPFRIWDKLRMDYSKSNRDNFQEGNRVGCWLSSGLLLGQVYKNTSHCVSFH